MHQSFGSRLKGGPGLAKSTPGDLRFSVRYGPAREDLQIGFSDRWISGIYYCILARLAPRHLLYLGTQVCTSIGQDR